VSDLVAEALTREVVDLEQDLALGDHYDVNEELDLLTQAILSHARSRLDIVRLEGKAQATETIDVEALRSAHASLDNDRVRRSRFDRSATDKDEILAETEFEEAGKMLEAVAEAAQNHHQFETAARLELGLAPRLFRLQIAIADQPELLSHLELKVRQKIARLPDDEIRRLWSLLTSEFQPSSDEMRSPPMPADTRILGEQFFDPRSVDDIRDRLTRYTVRLRPLIVRHIIESGVQSFRSALPSVAQFLALREVESLTLQERRLLTCLLRIFRAWGSEKNDEFASALGLKSPHWFERSVKLDQTIFGHKDRPNMGEKRKIILISLRRLIEQISAFVSTTSTIERAIIQYKLGLEIMLPAMREIVEQKREVTLQREFSRFLIERGIRAFGRQFGRAEADILAEIPGERFLLETKIAKHVTPRSFEKYVTQLLAYLDHEEPATRGVLVIYNISDTLIVGERQWLRHRLWILPINLCKMPPNKTIRRIFIEDGGDSAVLRFVPSLE